MLAVVWFLWVVLYSYQAYTKIYFAWTISIGSLFKERQPIIWSIPVTKIYTYQAAV